MTRAAIYARVSTDEQASRGTIENQIHSCRDYCEKAGFEVIKEFLDEGVSGTIPLIERPEGARLIAGADDHNFDVVVSYRLDRLGRDALVCQLAKRRLEKKVKLEFVRERFDDTPQGDFIFSVMAGAAELELASIRDRLQGGLQTKVREHGYYVASQRPYGYLKVDGNLKEHPKESLVVQEMFKLANQGMSSYAIARQLNAQGTPQPESTTKPDARNHRGWLHRTVRGFLQNPRYCSKATYGAGQIPMPCPPLVTPQLFDAVNAGLPTKKANSKRNTKHDYLLQKLLYCGECGKLYYSDTTHGKRVYCCSVVRSGGKEGVGHDGIRTRYSADYLEEAVIDWICRTVWQEDPAKAFSGFEFEVAEDPSAGVSETALARLDAELLNIDRKRLQTIDYATENAIDGADLKASLAILTTRKEETELELTRARKTLADSVDVAKTASSWTAWLKAHANPTGRVTWTEDEFRESGLEVQRAFTKAMIDRITIEDDGGRGRLRIEGRSRTSIPLYMNTPVPDYTITSGERVIYAPETSEGVTVGSPRTPRSRTQPMKR